MAGLQRTIQININLGETLGKPVPTPTPKEPPREMDGLLLRLANKDSLSDDELMGLTADVLAFVERKIKDGDLSEVREFLNAENRAMLTPEMKEVISDKLKALK